MKLSTIHSKAYNLTLIKDSTPQKQYFISISRPLHINKGRGTFNLAQNKNNNGKIIYKDYNLTLKNKNPPTKISIGYSFIQDNISINGVFSYTSNHKDNSNIKEFMLKFSKRF